MKGYVVPSGKQAFPKVTPTCKCNHDTVATEKYYLSQGQRRITEGFTEALTFEGTDIFQEREIKERPQAEEKDMLGEA